MLQPMTVTVDIAPGEQAYFKLRPLTSLAEFFQNLEWVVSVECITDGVELEFWEIV